MMMITNKKNEFLFYRYVINFDKMALHNQANDSSSELFGLWFKMNTEGFWWRVMKDSDHIEITKHIVKIGTNENWLVSSSESEPLTISTVRMSDVMPRSIATFGSNPSGDSRFLDFRQARAYLDAERR